MFGDLVVEPDCRNGVFVGICRDWFVLNFVHFRHKFRIGEQLANTLHRVELFSIEEVESSRPSA